MEKQIYNGELCMYHFLYLMKKVEKINVIGDYQLQVIREMIDSINYRNLYGNEEFKKAMIQKIEQYSPLSDFSKSGIPGYIKYMLNDQS